MNEREESERYRLQRGHRDLFIFQKVETYFNKVRKIQQHGPAVTRIPKKSTSVKLEKETSSNADTVLHMLNLHS